MTLFLQGLPLLLMRATMLEVMNDEFIVMARMKGLSRWSIVMRHAARNALLPVVTAFALGLGASIGGNVVIETVFAWPGIGRVLVQAVQGADYPVAQGAFIMIAFVLVIMNTVADLAYALARSQGVGRCAPLTPCVRFLRGEPFAAVGAAIYVVIVIMALFAPTLAPYDPRDMLRAGPPHRALPADLAASTGSAPPPAATTC